MPPPLAAQPLAVVSRNAHARPLCLTTNMKLKNKVNQRLILLNAIAVLGLAPPRRHAANFRGGYLVTREPREHQIGAQNMVEQHAAQVLEDIGRRQGPRPAGRRRRGRPSPRGLTSATNGVLLAPGFRDRGFGDCRCRLGRPVAYFDGVLKVFHEPYLPAIRNASVEPLPDRPGPRAQFDRDEFLPRDLTRLHAASRYTM